MSEDTKLKELIINTLSPEQLPAELSETEIYLVEDNVEYQEDLTTVAGYDTTKTQVLKHVNGVMQWVTE